MLRTLLPIIFAGLTTAGAAAHPAATSITLKPESAINVSRQPASTDAVRIVAQRELLMQRDSSSFAAGKQSQSSSESKTTSGKNSYGMLFATLFIMAAIAVRRQRSRRL